MSRFKVVMKYSDGTTEDVDGVFDTEEEARECGDYECSGSHLGAEILHMSNPWDNPPAEDDDVDYDVIEIDD